MSETLSTVTDTDAYTATFKAGKGFEDPWLVIRASSAADLHDKIGTAREAALMATIGGAAKEFHSAYHFGNKLDAEPINPPATEEKKAPVKGKKAPAKGKETPVKEEEPPAKADEPEPEEAPAEAPAKKPAAATKAPAKAKWKKAS